MKRKTPSKSKLIEHTSQVRVRFVETDPLGIVWHGNYIQYFEDGRESFGREHGISYLDQKEHGYATPIVKSSTDHKLPLRYGDIATIKTIYVDSPAAKMVFRYEIYNQNNQLVCTGETVQVFVDKIGEGDLSLTIPEFFMEWKKNVGLLND
ncbi:thioesterase family protein [Oceanihabitans sediminis]|uniref:Acyl-CoA thioesterase n=1 Tax=Oceanihabitans sediminis TaxID=1812012 RepID=A0A368P8T3_9FLAO|nr:acyl-CoA thioesterase [Oceanihabitans sediminis]MDX1279164.1 acyl-CoA thioesterase [Oceanihabitans sediminis]MDX1772865.1 acyl-CoA thioesterase [Oceanihabitans sediminis]RBP34543.1 acyl-CoA thioester hydrolase [Oceanihabitans sediminis]RCU58209.1 acyl-CoA thioesterase [Oceanihabitans sediminis]